MRAANRLGVIVALAMGASVPWTSARADAPASAMDGATREETTGQRSDATLQVFEQDPGAGGMEPVEAIDESPGESTHVAWVESIWSSP